MGEKYQLSGYTAGHQGPGSGGPEDRLGHCNPHDKTAWTSRRNARKALKNRHPEGGKSPYRCLHTGGWHYGTMTKTRDAYRGLGDGSENSGREMDTRDVQHELPGEQRSATQA